MKISDTAVTTICAMLTGSGDNLRGVDLTEEHWQSIRKAWIHFGTTFACCRPPRNTEDNTSSSDYDRAMEVFNQ